MGGRYKMSCNVKKHHRKRHPMSKGEHDLRELRFALIGLKRWRRISAYAGSKADRLARQRRERDALRDAGRNPYKRGGKK